jgi:hypothetical protein
MAPPIEIDRNKFSQNLNELIMAAQTCDEDKVMGCLKDMGIAYNFQR